MTSCYTRKNDDMASNLWGKIIIEFHVYTVIKNYETRMKFHWEIWVSSHGTFDHIPKQQLNVTLTHTAQRTKSMTFSIQFSAKTWRIELRANIDLNKKNQQFANQFKSNSNFTNFFITRFSKLDHIWLYLNEFYFWNNFMWFPCIRSRIVILE